MKRIVVVGGVAGGMSTAARLRRLDRTADIKVFEQDNDVSFANCGMPYYIGGVILDRDQLLVQTPESIRARYDIDVRVRHRVTEIDRQKKTVTVRNLDTGSDETFQWDNLVLSPGAFPIRPNLPGIDRPNVFVLKNLDDMDRIRAATVNAKRAVVVGAGYIGIEVAENLRHAGIIVDIVEKLDHVMPALDPEMTRQLFDELRLNRVKVHLSTEVTAFSDAGVHLGDGGVIPADFTVMSVGVRPVSKLAVDAGLKTTPSGHVMVDAHMRTSDPDIYAVGDAVAVHNPVTGTWTANPLAGPANRQGRIAADNICGRPSTYKGTQGTAIAKVFGLSAAGTGMNEKQIKAAGVKYHRVWVHPNQHPGYYPGAAPLDMKIIFDDQGKLLGAQVVGHDGVDTAINSFAQAMRAGQTVYDLEEMELAYCPVWGNAKHPVNMAGFVAANVLRGDVEVIEPWEKPDLWLDVREEDEVLSGQIPGSINIPMGQIGARLPELPKGREIGVYCAVGLRGYIVYRRLKQLGYNVKNLNGGIRTWHWFTPQDDVGPGPLEIKAPSAGVVPGLAVYSGSGTAEQPVEQAAGRSVATAAAARTVKLDVCGLQCPGPLLKVRKAMDGMNQGEVLEVLASDPGFAADIPMWAKRTGNTLLDVGSEDGKYRAVLKKTADVQTPTSCVGSSCGDAGIAVHNGPKGKTIVVFSNDFDKVMAAFIIANGAAAMGAPVTMFFTFWGLNVLRSDSAKRVKKSFVERMFGFMMPKGVHNLKISKMNMGGAGTAMMKKIMKDKNVLTLDDLIESARENGTRMIACAMSMDVMGIRKEELIEGIEIAGVGNYLGTADEGNVNLFI